MINPVKLMKIKGAWEIFVSNHPKFPAFLHAMKVTGIKEGSIIEIHITDPDGKKISTNIKVQQSDVELLNDLSEMIK